MDLQSARTELKDPPEVNFDMIAYEILAVTLTAYVLFLVFA